jgi:hypothetical protein
MKTLVKAFKFLGTVGGCLALAVAGVSYFVGPAQSDDLLIPNTFVAGTIADPAAVNANFTAVADTVNGSLDNNNWDPSGPDLSYANIDLESSVNSTDIANTTIQSEDVSANALGLNKLDATVNQEVATQLTGGTGDTAVPDAETAVITQAAYTPDAITSILIIHGKAYYKCICYSGGVLANDVILTIYVDGNKKGESRFICDPEDNNDNEGMGATVNVFAFTAAGAGGPFAIELRHEKEARPAHGFCATTTYEGATSGPATLDIVELKSD